MYNKRADDTANSSDNADNETYLNIFKTLKNIIAKTKSRIGLTPSTTPALVATALPPLNLR